MKYIAVILLGVVFVSTSCFDDKNCHNKITIVNDSDNAVYFYLSHRYPDTLTLYPNPVPGNNGNKIERHASGKDLFEDCIEYDFESTQSGIIMYYIYDAQTLETVPWDSVVKKYMILKRYELSLDDLQRMNWTITYP